MRRKKIEGQSESIALLAEFEGQKIEGHLIAILSYRIDGLVRTAALAERNRCFAAMQKAFGEAGEAITADMGQGT